MFWLNSNGAIIVNSDGLPINCDYCPCIEDMSYLFYRKDYQCTFKSSWYNEDYQPRMEIYRYINRWLDSSSPASTVCDRFIGFYNYSQIQPGSKYQDAVRIANIDNDMSVYNQISSFVLYKNDSEYGQQIDPVICDKNTLNTLNYDSAGGKDRYGDWDYDYYWRSFMLSSTPSTPSTAIGINLYIKQISQKTGQPSSVTQSNVPVLFGQQYLSLQKPILTQPYLVSSAQVYRIPDEQLQQPTQYCYGVSGLVTAPSSYLHHIINVQISAVSYIYG